MEEENGYEKGKGDRFASERGTKGQRGTGSEILKIGQKEKE
jgi:hypothetical protein